MTVTVRLPTQLRDATGGSGEVVVAVAGGSVQSVIDALFEAHGELRGRLTGEDGELRRFVNVYVDGEDIRFGDGVETLVPDGGEIQILPAVAGG
jgi:molybdopterin synthase sulfur carrier subunit